MKVFFRIVSGAGSNHFHLLFAFVFVEKIPASKVPSSFAKQTRPSDPVSPTSSTSSQEELLTLRARNKILTDALAAIKESASEEMKKKFDLVWFARYRCKYILSQ